MFAYIGHIFNLILVTPILNLLVFTYSHVVHDVGLDIIILTVFIRTLLLPSFHKSLKSQAKLTAIQPHMNAIREKHKDNKEEQAKKMMELYKEHNINPLGSCLPLLVQLPLLLALYQVFIIILQNNKVAQSLYPFISNPGYISPYFLHFLDLSKPSWILGVVAGAAQYFQSRMMVPKEKSTDPTQQMMVTQMLYLLPLLTIFISLKLPAGLPIYWITTTLFAIGQQYYILRTQKSVAPLAVVEMKK